MRVYLDWNATTPPHDDVISAMAEAAKNTWGNPSSVHGDGRLARSIVEDARTSIGALARANARDVFFTSGATEANNLAILSAMRSREGVLITSRLEHPSITRVAERFEQEGRVRWLRVSPDGVIDLEDLEKGLAEGKVAAIALQAVNHETGVIQPVDDVLRLAKKANTWVHVDAAQAWGKIETDFHAQSCSMAPHKFRGPKGIGALIVAPGTKLTPLAVGGAQEKGIRPGTMDAALAAGFSVAARRAMSGPDRYADVARLRDEFETAIGKLHGNVNGARSPRAPHVTSAAWRGWLGPELVAALDLEGVSCSSGSACSAGTAESSPVLQAMLGEEIAASSIRISLGETTTRAEIQRAIVALANVLSRVEVAS